MGPSSSKNLNNPPHMGHWIAIFSKYFSFLCLDTDCGQLYFNGTQYSQPEGGFIRMPELLSTDLISLQDLPHTCTFILTNLNAKGQIRLVFDDFLMYGGNESSPSCDWPVNQDQLEVWWYNSTGICFKLFLNHGVLWKFIKQIKGVLYPRPDFGLFCIFLKNYNTLVTSKICFL